MPSTDAVDSRRDLHELALKRFKLASEAETQQRQRELEDLKFVDFDEQWPEEIRNQRSGTASGSGLPAVPARPCLTINKLNQPVDQITNQVRQQRLALQFTPEGGGANRETADMFEDIVRAIQADSRAHLARQWACDRAFKCGRGAYRVLTAYANDDDDDLDIVYRRILNQASVYLDPAAQEPDWSDGKWAFITEDLPWDRYKAEYGKSKVSEMDDAELAGVGDDQPDWIRDSDTGRVIRVAEYFYIVTDSKETSLYACPDGGERRYVEGEHPPECKKIEGAPKRTIETQSVKWAKINAFEVLDQQDWPGKYIPIIPVIGKESNAGGERRWTGLVRPAMDAQRSYNYMRSAQVEAVGLAPKAPFIGYIETIEGFEDWWQQANVRNFPLLPVKFVRDGSGSPLPPPQRQVAEPAIQAITLATHEADGDIKATTGIFDASLGNLNPSDRSGKAILALQKQAETGSQAYLDNLAQMSMIYEGKILRDLIPKVYNRPGRVVAAIGGDDVRRQVMLNQPFVTGPDGQPQPPGPGEQPRVIDLSKGRYSVAIKIGKAFNTRQEQQGSMLSDLAAAAPQLLPAFADVWVEDMDMPGGQRIAERIRKVTGMGDDEQSQQIPPQVAQQIQQMQQLIQQLSGDLEAKTEIIRTDAVKNQANLQIKQLQEQAENERAVAEEETKRAEIQAKQALEFRKLEVQLQIEMAKLGSAESMARGEIEMELLHAHGEQAMRKQELDADTARAAMDRQASRDDAEADRQQESQEGERDRQATAVENERGRQFEAVEGERDRQAERESAAEGLGGA